jgi:hypothetical protein
VRRTGDANIRPSMSMRSDGKLDVCVPRRRGEGGALLPLDIR